MMDPVVAAAIVAAVAAVTGSGFTLYASRKAEGTKLTTLETTAHLENLKIQMAGWPELLEQYRQEIARKNEEIEQLREDLETAYAELHTRRKDDKRP